MIIWTYGENLFDKIQLLLMIKTFSKMQWKGTALIFFREEVPKSTAKSELGNDTFKAFILR